MSRGFNGFRILSIGTAMLVAGCSSDDQKAAAAASNAETALNTGQPQLAQQFIRRALAARDDVGDYWILAAHIAVAMNDNVGAFDAYRNVLASDRGNQEALSALCQLALVRKHADPGGGLRRSARAVATRRSAAADRESRHRDGARR